MLRRLDDGYELKVQKHAHKTIINTTIMELQI
jgi:hypothetical protein